MVWKHSYAGFVGLDYDYNRDCALYQNILYRILDDAIKEGASSVDLARTAMEIKSTMGAEPVSYRLDGETPERTNQQHCEAVHCEH
jgi:hypothetical protein